MNVTTSDETLCELCWNDHTATFRDDEGRPVCGTHANVLEDGSWDGEPHEIVPLTPEEDQEEIEYVFVYGTLRNGSGYDAELKGFTKDDTGQFPTLIPSPDHTVCGEVHKVTTGRLRNLDRYEGTPHLYKRVEGPLGVWVYIGDPEKLGSKYTLPFEREFLQEQIDDATLTLEADFDPRKMPIERA
ncbi:gamma-glutamylcyclotransferase family protein [Natronosalvus rutilus]|uniref:Gamma-glutamylcyclotransferase n=1 Tax=Natronosalvus rutilus TaxID=2953753 RepID=A0A9E7SVM6_9EURY|nr:gamma-glutamylcyclotransferase family protein [Natronosalvus rutilus]UTF56019.1 gamma-glutamylcyclotransferase [Natronosalvus rutilus]